jgi:hypothetical protein
MASVSTVRSLLPGAEMGPEVSTVMTGGGCSTSRKLVRGLSLLSCTNAPSLSLVENPVPADTSKTHEVPDSGMTSYEAAETDGLIPGLLDEVALICLALLPSSEWRTARQVCTSWRKLFCSQEGFADLTPVRQRLDSIENWVFVKSANTSADTPWRAFELKRGLTKAVPRMPGQGSRYSWTAAGVAAAGGKLFCTGWKDDNIYAFTGSIFPASLSSFLWVYCPVLNRWSEKQGVPSPRTHFACASDGRRLYLAGGRMGGSIMEQGEQLASAWVYHVDQDRCGKAPSQSPTSMSSSNLLQLQW